MEYKDYYKTLGVPRNADDKEIKKAFRQLAHQHHPDKNPGDASAEQKFKEINEAYTVLSDTDKRGKYDQFGDQWERHTRSGGQPDGFDWGPWGSGGDRQSRTMTPEEFEQMFGGSMGGGGFSSFFDTLFSGAAGGQAFNQRARTGRYGYGTDPFAGAQPRAQIRPTEVDVTVSLQESFAGTTRMLHGSDNTRFEIDIPKGVKSGSKVRVKGAGGLGDIILKVTVTSHPQFKRESDNLRIQVPVEFHTAILGGEVAVPTLDGSVVLTIPAGTQGGKTFRLRGLGMPHLKNSQQRGDLYAEITIQIPTNLSDRERTLVEELRELRK